jgi:choline dehydrogenase
MLSGIGPEAQLKKFGIPLVQNTEGVGMHLTDHPVVDIHLKQKLGASVEWMKDPKSLSARWNYFAALLNYMIFKKGPFAINVSSFVSLRCWDRDSQNYTQPQWGESAVFLRTDDPKLFPKEVFPKTLTDTTSGPGSPDIEIFITPLAYKDHGGFFFGGPSFALHVCLLRWDAIFCIKRQHLISAKPFKRGKTCVTLIKPMDAAFCQSQVSTLCYAFSHR